MKALNRAQISFKMNEITYLDRKTIFLDRGLLRLFERLRFDGRAVVHRKQRAFDVPGIANLMIQDETRFPGFASQPDVAESWLRSDLLDIMNRGQRDGEKLVGLRPFHLNAFKVTNTAAAQDWGASDQVWAMIYHADHSLLGELRDFFGEGLDFATDRYDGVTALDVHTMAVLGIADAITVMHDSTALAEPHLPLCLGQGAVLADDIRRILAYRTAIPRLVLAGYIRTLIGLHLALYQMRLFDLIPSWVGATRGGPGRLTCQAEAAHQTTTGCPHLKPICIDLTGDVNSAAGQVARRSTETHLTGIPAYVRSVILINRLKEFAAVHAASHRIAPPRTVGELLDLLASAPSEMEGYFLARISDVMRADADDETDDPLVAGIVALPGSALDRYVELICLRRMRQEQGQLVRLVDSLALKNRIGGFIRQNPGTRSPRWFSMDSHLLEVLVQVAVVDRSGSTPATRPILLHEFVELLYARYGFEIYAPAHRDVPPEDEQGWQQNQRALRERLHQIGFFTDLSDAFNSQTLRPRYEVGGG